nr:hypothetical protein [Streptomyces sp. NRRL F-5123]
MSPAELVRVAGIRRCIEACFQSAKGQVGLDHCQVRHWTARHRHITLAVLALAILTAPAADAAPGGHAVTAALIGISLTGGTVRAWSLHWARSS